jgi:hypothetical protein
MLGQFHKFVPGNMEQNAPALAKFISGYPPAEKNFVINESGIMSMFVSREVVISTVWYIDMLQETYWHSRKPEIPVMMPFRGSFVLQVLSVCRQTRIKELLPQYMAMLAAPAALKIALV